MKFLITYKITDDSSYDTFMTEEIEAKDFCQAERKFYQIPKHKDAPKDFERHDIVKIEAL